jgi:lambda family phage portal protein
MSRRAAAALQRSYDAGIPDRLVNGWSLGGWLTSERDELAEALPGMIAHSRHLARRNDYMRAFLGLVSRNVIGPQGIRLQMDVREIDGRADGLANDLIEAAWSDWSRPQNCSVNGRLGWHRLQVEAARMAARDGAVLVRMYRGRKFGAAGLQLRLMPIEYLDLQRHQVSREGNTVHAGVEVDDLGRVAALHLHRQHPGARWIMAGGRRGEVERVPADQVLILSRPEDPDGVLGAPWGASAFRRLNMMGDYESAALNAARYGARKIGFFEQMSEEGALPPGEIEMEDQEAGEFEYLPPGTKVSTFDPAYPDGDMAPFMALMLRGAAAGLGVAYSSLANDLTGANFSSLRAGLGEERDEWRMLQSWMTDALCVPVFAAWLDMAMLTGAVPLPASKVAKFNRARWRARGWASVDPIKEAQANESDLALRLKSPFEIVAARGADLEEVYADIKRAADLAASHGLSPMRLPAAVPPEGVVDVTE